MAQRQRFHALMHGEVADELCQCEAGYWPETLQRWRREGLSSDEHPWEQLGITWYEHLPIQFGIWPPFEFEVLPEDEETIAYRDGSGVVARGRRDGHSMPQWLEFPVKIREDFERLKERLDPTDPRRYPPDWDQHVA